MKINENTGEVELNDEILHLTRGELKVIKYLSEHTGIVTYEELYGSYYNMKLNKKLKPYHRQSLVNIVSRLRLKGFNIKTYVDYGYELIKEN